MSWSRFREGVGPLLDAAAFRAADDQLQAGHPDSPERFFGRGQRTPLLKENVEKELHEAIPTVNEGIGDYWTKGRYEQILEMLATLYVPLNRFFEGVMVMDPNEEIRENRLSLLSWVRTLFDEFGDFSKIVEGESSPKPEQK
ncbi:MAG: DALR anticodon-binding domain-containing protein [Candidatus Manganitrophus sp.]|nr:DALR anticodon-binding domain-containing protein [Candidatus Manganitrophus sp.]